MSLIDKILGKKEEERKPEGKEKKPTSIKTGKKKEKPLGKAKVERPRREKVKTERAVKAAKKEENIAYRILLEPHVTEKSSGLGQFNKYVFKVSQVASKGQVGEAIQSYYGVGVTGVNMVKISPKKRIHGRKVGFKKGYKKAIVTLQAGDTITTAEGV